MALVPEVESRLTQLFPGEAGAAARDLLPAESDLGDEAAAARVQLAVLALAGGSLDKLTYYSDVARKDWRDVLYWSETDREEEPPRRGTRCENN